MNQKASKTVKLLGMLFSVFSVFYIFYAACSQRGLYDFGSMYFIKMLDNIADKRFDIYLGSMAPQIFVSALQQIPALLAGVLTPVKSRITLATIYSLSMFAFPFIALWWNYELTKRTKEYSILFWSVFSYCVFILVSQMAITESASIAIPIQFVLFNYLIGKIHYTKWDKIGIAFLIFMLFCMHENVILVGCIMFFATFLTAFETKNPNDLLTKICIGGGSLFAAFHTMFFIIFHHEYSIRRTIKDALFQTKDFLVNINHFCIIIPIFTILLLCLLFYRRKRITKYISLFIGVLYLMLFVYMFINKDLFLAPLYETNTRFVLSVITPIVLIGIAIYKYKFNDKGYQSVVINNAYIPVLLCGIVLTSWQIVNTYYWNQNIAFLQKEISSCEDLLYIPEEHEQISDYFDENLRRYIPYYSYTAISIIYNDKYKIQPLILNKDIEYSELDRLWVSFDRGLISIPYIYKTVKITNKFWNMEDVASAIEDYDEEYEIQTDRPENPEEIEYP